jgi:hypothetical protein
LICLPLRANPVPVIINDNFILCEATIEGQEVLLVLDSGAPGLVLNTNYYNPNGTTTDQVCFGVNGSFQCKTKKIRSWTWLGIEFNKSTAILSDLSYLEKALHRKIDGLASLSLLTDYYVTLDLDRQMITLTKNENAGQKFTRFQYVDHVPVIDVRVNGVAQKLGIDTGSEGNYLFGNEKVLSGYDTADASPIVVIGTDNQTDIKHLVKMDLSLHASQEAYISEFIVDLQDDSFINDPRFDGLLGQSFLSRFNITIHPGKQKICFESRVASSTGTFISSADLK